MTPEGARRGLLETSRRMSAVGLTPGTSGNVSVRLGDGFLITPSGVPYDDLRADDLVFVRADGTVRPGQKLPSSEWRLHRDLYARRPESGAIVHAHPTFCTTLACLGRAIPAVHYMIAVTGAAKVPCAPYATFGTEALSRATVEALGAGKACLMANHGMVALGAELGEALKIATEVEHLAQIYWRALQVGAPNVLGDDEMRRVIEKFASYGQPKRRRSP